MKNFEKFKDYLHKFFFGSSDIVCALKIFVTFHVLMILSVLYPPILFLFVLGLTFWLATLVVELHKGGRS